MYASKPISTSRSSNSCKVPKWWTNSFHLLKPHTTWRCADIEAMCTTDFGITVCRADFHSKGDGIGIIIVMMWHGFSLPITNDMAQLLNYFDVYLSNFLCWCFLFMNKQRCKQVTSRFASDLKRIWILHVTEGADTYALHHTARWINFREAFPGSTKRLWWLVSPSGDFAEITQKGAYVSLLVSRTPAWESSTDVILYL